MAFEAERHEPPDVQIGRILAYVGTFVAIAVVMGFGLRWYYDARIGGTQIATRPQDFPAPRLQPNPGQDWTNFRATQAEQLEGYAWVDRDKALVHVPIDRAMALVVAAGPKGYDPVAGSLPPDLRAPLDGAPRATPSPPVAPYGMVR